MVDFRCWKCNTDIDMKKDDVTTWDSVRLKSDTMIYECKRCGAGNEVPLPEDKNFYSPAAIFGIFVFIGSLVVFWYAFEMSTWGNYESLMAPQYMTIALILLIFGVVIIALGRKSINNKKMKYEREVETFFERIKVQENSENNSDRTSHFCIKCGDTLVPNAKFCGKCGTKITGSR